MFVSFRSKIIATLIVTVIVFGGGGAVAASWMNQSEANKVISEMKSANENCKQSLKGFSEIKPLVDNLHIDSAKFPAEAQKINQLLTPKVSCESNLTGKMYVKAMKAQQKEIEDQLAGITDAMDEYEAAKTRANQQKVEQAPEPKVTPKKKATPKKKTAPKKQQQPKKQDPKQQQQPKQQQPAPNPQPAPQPAPNPQPQPAPQPAPEGPVHSNPT